MLNRTRLSELINRLRRADYNTLPVLCGHVIEYIKTNVSPHNAVYISFEHDRQSKWKDWGSEVARLRQWDLPATAADCASLAWHVMCLIAEVGEASIQLLYCMYGKRHFNDNVAQFLGGWEAFIQEAIDTLTAPESIPEGEWREKQQKFGILDSPTLYLVDAHRIVGHFGKAAIYLDLDNFKALNERLTEVKVDALVLPEVHKLLRECVAHLGFAYAEGGDEFLILLPNANEQIGAVIAHSLRHALSLQDITDDDGTVIPITASCGVAHAAASEDPLLLKQNANTAMRFAKQSGKGQVAVWSDGSCKIHIQERQA